MSKYAEKPEVGEDIPMYKGVPMGKRILPNGKAVWIIHEMADGEIRDSVDEYEVPYNENTHNIYQLCVSLMKDYLEKKLIKKSNSEDNQ